MLSKFYKEMYGMETIQNSDGVIVYKQLEPGKVLIEILWVKPSKRATHCGSDLCDMVVKKTSARVLFCQIDKKTNYDYAETAKAIIKYGFKPIENTLESIMLIKEL